MALWMARRGAATIGVLAGLLGAGCGPAPYTLGPEEPQAEPLTVVVVDRAQPVEAERPDRWIPEVFPRPNPFARHRTWVGMYDCPQGPTNLTLRITDVHDAWVRGVFDFHHVPSDAGGQYLVAGSFDDGSGRVNLAPGPWILRPDGYLPVGMDGAVSRDNRRFIGRIIHPGCGAFRLRPVE